MRIIPKLCVFHWMCPLNDAVMNDVIINQGALCLHWMPSLDVAVNVIAVNVIIEAMCI